ncbi:MAG TPA: SDR family oxidoreductase [Gammaproteobacteria bacterium]|nr:SDR family oxidoreductase [Gammaproteobacteria bacterium]
MDTPCILITGAGSGIGRATARLFAGHDWTVGAFDVDDDALAGLAGEERIVTRHMDVTDPQSVEEGFADFGERTGQRLDLLFNCAGILEIGPFESVSLERHARLIDVNFKGLMHCTRVAFPFLQRTRGAQVINMSSASAGYGTPDLATYSATKFAVRGLTEALNIEWARHGIRVCDIMPPYVDTPMVRNARHTASLDRMGVNLAPETVAAAVWSAVGSDRVHHLVGRQYRLMSALLRLFPASLNRRLVRSMTGY